MNRRSHIASSILFLAWVAGPVLAHEWPQWRGPMYWEHPTPWERWPIAIATPVLHGDHLPQRTTSVPAEGMDT